MTSRNQPSLPANHAFVMRLPADAHPEDGRWKGWVEHVVSMESEHFESLEQLTALIARLLTHQN